MTEEYRQEGDRWVAGPALDGHDDLDRGITKRGLIFTIVGCVAALVIVGAYLLLVGVGGGDSGSADVPEPVASTPASAPVEQGVVDATADFIASHPFTERAAEKLRLGLAATGCEVASFDIVLGLNRSPLPAETYQAIREFGPRYDENEGHPFTLIMAVTC